VRGDVGGQVTTILNALADLAPSSEQRSNDLSIPLEWFRWLSAASVRLLAPEAFLDPLGPSYQPSTQRVAPIDRDFAERLAAIDQIRPGQRPLRVGWLFVAGRIELEDGRTRGVFHPLVSVPVRVVRPPAFGQATLVPAGDVTISDRVVDLDERNRLEGQIEYGGGGLDDVSDVAIPDALLGRLPRLQRFARAVAAAADLPAAQVIRATDGPEKLVRSEGLRIVAGVGVYATHSTGTTSRAGSLRAWAATTSTTWTSLHSLYLDRPPPPPTDLGAVEEEVTSPLLLTPAQRQAVLRSRSDPVTLVSGAPGTGKSHTVVAIALDALARGQSVLVAARSDATVDALLDLLERSPGPDPVVFGSNERREALAARLAGGQLQPSPEGTVRSASEAMDAARKLESEATATIVGLLAAEQVVASGGPADDGARRCAPLLFEPDTDLDDIARRLGELATGATGWFGRRRQRRLLEATRSMAGCDPGTPTAELERALRVARAHRVASGLIESGGLEIGRAWNELLRLGDDARLATARWLAAESRSARRINRTTLPAIAAAATALRSGRAARREQLSRLADDRLTRALPLWVGSLPDIDDLLPPIAGTFDLVILDEASSIDQPLAAPALLRARRAVVVGDPQQLRHVSFLSDARQLEVMRSTASPTSRSSPLGSTSGATAPSTSLPPSRP
jgi:hypothetical protein